MSIRIRLQEAFKFALSMVLMYWLALWMDWDLARYGALAIVLISLSTSGASINKGVMRVIGTIIGCTVGLILVAWFSQERWNMMFAISAYLVFTGYYLQTSRYPYAWFVAGFVSIVIWSDTYGAVDNSFHFAIFRLLETVSGILIYTMVSVLLWPQTAGVQFYQQGSEYLKQLCRVLKFYQDALEGIKHDEAAAVQRKQDVLFTQLQGTLSAAVNDTMMVREQKHEWMLALTSLHELTNSLALWRSTSETYQQRTPGNNQANFKQVLKTIEQRCTRIGELWQARQLPGEVSPGDDKPLLQTLTIDLSLPHTITNTERGLLMNQADLLRQLDQQSQNLLILLRVLNGLDSTVTLTDPLPSSRPSRWDTVRLLKALVPACTFILGFLFWIYPTSPPPSGQTIAEMSGIFGLAFVLGADVRYIGLAFGAAGLLVIAPIYFVVMPWLDGGAGLLIMIFLLSFTSAYLGARWPMVKSSVMVLFVMTTGISNEQNYSFMAWVSSEFGMIMSGLIVNLVVMFMLVIRPEKIMARRIRSFFYDCAAVTRDFVNVAEKRRRAEHFMREVRRAPGELSRVERTLDYSRLPADAQERINHLLDSIESVSARLRMVKVLIEKITVNTSFIDPATTPLGVELPQQLQRVFERWAMATKSAVVSGEERGEINKLYNKLEERIDMYYAQAGSPAYSEQMGTDLIALLGGVHGLLDAMAETDSVIHEIHWSQWVEARI
ncbi:FUSC family protein [Methyloprofundus sp.]|uniref:FUSC family protein n=1 Tax=Methyloprofundus sp. TaxID=2020875 RepID=UPI003D0D68E6